MFSAGDTVPSDTVYLVNNAVFFSKEVRLFTFLVPVILFPKASSVTLYGSKDGHAISRYLLADGL